MHDIDNAANNKYDNYDLRNAIYFGEYAWRFLIGSGVKPFPNSFMRNIKKHL